MEPPPKRHAGQWAEEHFRFSPGDPEQGAFRQHRIPWWETVFEAASDPVTREMTIVTGSQMSKTTSMLIIAMHRMHDGPRVPIMLVEPSKDLARSVAERTAAAVESCEPLFELMAKGRRARLLERFYADVRWGFAWSGSKLQLRSHPVGLAIADEISAYAEDVEGEGSPLVLLSGRTKNYPRSLLLKTSTPTIDGACAGQQSFLSGTMEILQWQCPHCSAWYQPLPAHMRWPDGATPTQAQHEGTMDCPHCNGHITDSHVGHLRQTARWWPHKRLDDGALVPLETKAPSAVHRSFWATGVFSPWVTLEQLRHRLCQAYHSKHLPTIQAELNVWWGCWWQMSGERPRWQKVMDHRGTYKKGTVPDHCRGLVLAVDVQQDRLEWSVWGFGANFRKWLVDWGQLWGDTQYDDVWVALAQFQHRRYGSLPITRCIVDSGYSPGYDTFQRPQHKAYEFARRCYGWAFAYKGYAETQQTLRLSKSQRDGILYLAHSTYFKRMIYAEINQDDGNLQVPADVSEDMCKQLVSEEMLILPSGRIKWRVSRHQPNHQLDCAVMACVAAYSLNWQQIQITNPAAPTQNGGPVAPRIRMPEIRRRR